MKRAFAMALPAAALILAAGTARADSSACARVFGSAYYDAGRGTCLAPRVSESSCLAAPGYIRWHKDRGHGADVCEFRPGTAYREEPRGHVPHDDGAFERSCGRQLERARGSMFLAIAHMGRANGLALGPEKCAAFRSAYYEAVRGWTGLKLMGEQGCASVRAEDVSNSRQYHDSVYAEWQKCSRDLHARDRGNAPAPRAPQPHRPGLSGCPDDLSAPMRCITFERTNDRGTVFGVYRARNTCSYRVQGKYYSCSMTGCPDDLHITLDPGDTEWPVDSYREAPRMISAMCVRRQMR